MPTKSKKTSARRQKARVGSVAGSGFAGALALSLRNMACYYGQHPIPGPITESDAIGIALADMAHAVDHAAKGEYWESRDAWKPYRPNV